MADISMCKNKSCPSFGTCYRAQANANPYRQSYGMFDNKGKDKCENYYQAVKTTN